MSVVNSGGLTPISVTEGDGMVTVLNAGGAGNVAGFRNTQGLHLIVSKAPGSAAWSQRFDERSAPARLREHIAMTHG
jgi:hypothetical protein